MQFFAFLVFQLSPRILQSVSKFVYFFDQQIRSSNRISHPASSHEIFQQFSKSFAHFFRFIIFCRIFLSEYCSLIVKVSFVLFFWKFCVGFEVDFMFEFFIYIDMVEGVFSLPKYYVCIRHVHALCACHCKSKAGLCLYIYINSF